ncbi:hypothetical protein GCM10022243_64500 [Saccharothrix violaceirubra]
MNIRRVLVKAAGISAAGMLVFVPVASADVHALGAVYQGDDYAWSNGSDVEVCDREADGHGVYGEFNLSGGSKATVRDTNGSASGCGTNRFNGVRTFRVCEVLNNLPDPCSSWGSP